MEVPSRNQDGARVLMPREITIKGASSMPSRIPPEDPRDATIRRLRDSLYVARHALLDLMPEQLRTVLSAAIYCDTFADEDAWREWAVLAIIGAADVRAGIEMGDLPCTERAFCPLCGASAQSPYSRGFSIPEGLRRHLEGSHRSRQCSVFNAAEDTCLDRLRDRANGRGLKFETPKAKPWDRPTSAPDQPKAPGAPGTVIPFPRRTR
jgi:hypothetical protein